MFAFDLHPLLLSVLEFECLPKSDINARAGVEFPVLLVLSDPIPMTDHLQFIRLLLILLFQPSFIEGLALEGESKSLGDDRG